MDSAAAIFASFTANVKMDNQQFQQGEKTFCSELRERTKVIHDQSDKLINLKLVVVLTDTTLYAEVLADFYFVFQNLEEALKQHYTHRHVAPLYVEALLRTAAFERDLQFYLGPTWRTKVRPSPAATEYCNRILQVSEEDPVLLIAYAHSMYLALLAGGQIIKRIVKRTLGLPSLPGADGLAIFDFEYVNKLQVKNKFMDNIDQMELTRDEKEAIFREKILVFQMNNAIANNVKPTASSYSRLAQFLSAIFIFLLLLFYFIFYILL